MDDYDEDLSFHWRDDSNDGSDSPTDTVATVRLPTPAESTEEGALQGEFDPYNSAPDD